MEDVRAGIPRGRAAALWPERAVERKTGARGLRSILEQSLLDTMYDLPSLRNAAKVVVDEGVIQGGVETACDLRELREVSKAAPD